MFFIYQTKIQFYLKAQNCATSLPVNTKNQHEFNHESIPNFLLVLRILITAINFLIQLTP